MLTFGIRLYLFNISYSDLLDYILNVKLIEKN